MTTPRRPPTGAAVLDPAVTDAITTAVIDELVESSYARLAIDRVARRAGVGKSAIYRRWPSKLPMVVDGLTRLSTPNGPAPDTGSLRGDVRAVVQAAYDWLTDPRIRAVLPDLIAEADRDPVLAEGLAEHVTQPRLAWARTALDRARDRGELAAEDVEMVLDLAIAPVFWRLTHARPVDDRYLDRLTDLTIGVGAALAAPAPAASIGAARPAGTADTAREGARGEAPDTGRRPGNRPSGHDGNRGAEPPPRALT